MNGPYRAPHRTSALRTLPSAEDLVLAGLGLAMVGIDLADGGPLGAASVAGAAAIGLVLSGLPRGPR